MFEVSLVAEAVARNVPFLQCRKYFHTVSIPTLQGKAHSISCVNQYM